MSTIILIAGGPSLTRADVALCEQSGHPLLGINNAYQITDKLSIHYACDTKWWRKHWNQIYKGPDRYSLKKNDKDAGVTGVTQMENDGTYGISHQWPKLRTGQNSGYQAINLAYLLGYKTLILLGYDMQETGGEVHWHGLHQGLMNPSDTQFSRWRENFIVLAHELRDRGLEVINATRQTALECFPRADLEKLL